VVEEARRQISKRCERAVVTAYCELRDRGTPDPVAFSACTTLYRIHHPEASISAARDRVAAWIDHFVVGTPDDLPEACPCD
jgi:hypothetical protein